MRLTHIPTGIAVACQNQRSQHQNRDKAWKMLRARLYELELQKREAAAQAVEASKSDIGWGHQIRSYVLQPYQMVKDLRTDVETSDTDGVLNGDLDRFMAASLAQRVGATRETRHERDTGAGRQGRPDHRRIAGSWTRHGRGVRPGRGGYRRGQSSRRRATRPPQPWKLWA